MFSKILSNGQSQLLRKALNIYQKQHEAISKNVSNASNENYNRVNTDFSSQLNNAKNSTPSLKTSSAKHLSGSNNENSNSNKNSQGSVDITREMGLLAENQIKYEFATRALSRMYKGISTSITGKTR